MKELNIDFREHLHRFGPGPNFAAFRAFSPTGRVPCLIDGAVVVWDSLAIMEYLAERHERVWPRDRAARAWARAAAAEMHAGFETLRTVCGMNCGLRIKLNGIDAPLVRDIDRMDELWREGLDRFDGPFLSGEKFGAVDAFFAPVAFRIQTFDLKMSAAALAYAERLRALPGMVDWYAAGLAENFRDVEHEHEAALYGTVITDLRAIAD